MKDVNINTADGEQWARMYAIALKREQELLAERDRLRKALIQLSIMEPHWKSSIDVYAHDVRSIALKALAETEEER